jgi:hypothetical protein
MEKKELEEGDIVQISPDHPFAGFFLIVTEPKEWGAQGYLFSAYHFAAVEFEDMEFCGKSHWIMKDEKEHE